MSKEPLTLDALRKTVKYMQLTEHQRKLIDAFVTHGHDRLEAYQATHSSSTKKTSAAGAARKLFAMPAMVAALNAYFQIDALDAVRADIRRAMLNKNLTAAQAGMVRLYAAANGISIGEPAELPTPSTPTPEGTVVEDKTVERDGRKYRRVITDMGPVEGK
jgi:hypothetical protein